MSPSPRSTSSPVASSRRGWFAPLTIGLLAANLGVLVFLATGGDRATPRSARELLLGADLPALHAQLGEGDYEFLPSRLDIWVVNRRNGRLIHYKFLDPEQGKVERSYTAQVDQNAFPPEDTEYVLSEHGLTDYLWVGNRRTGDFQVWRRSVRDGRLMTNEELVQAARQLSTPALPAPGSEESP
jgi:hypothetical protein